MKDFGNGRRFILGVEHEWKGKEEKGWKSTRRKEDGRKV